MFKASGWFMALSLGRFLRPATGELIGSADGSAELEMAEVVIGSADPYRTGRGSWTALRVVPRHRLQVEPLEPVEPSA